MPIVSNKSLTPKQSALTERELKHLLRRTTFGLSYKQFEQYQNWTFEKVVKELLAINPEIEQPLNYYQNIKADNKIPYGQTWVNSLPQDDIVAYRIISFLGRMYMNMLDDTSITEKMTFFLHSFIPISYKDDGNTANVYGCYKMLRSNCLGNFKTIIKLISVNPSMLVYLNGRFNKKGEPDENYARELMELFTLGKNYSPIYNEQDIQQAAKVLTGYWNHELTYVFAPPQHDTSDKTFSSFFGNKVIKGKSGYDGKKELDELIDMIFEKEEVSVYFVTRLYRYFVYYEIDDIVKNNIINPLAKIMRDNNYEIKPVIEALIKSEHFYDMNVIGSHIKNPLDLIFGSIKELNMTQHDRSVYVNSYRFYGLILNDHLNSMDLQPYHPVNVAGWSAYYQAPLYLENWITTSTIIERQKFMNLYMNGISYYGPMIKFDLLKTTLLISDPSNVNILIDEVLDRHLTVIPSNEIKAYMKSILLYGQIEDHYWTDLWNSYISNPSDLKIKTQLTNVLKEFYMFLVSLPEYQLM